MAAYQSLKVWDMVTVAFNGIHTNTYMNMPEQSYCGMFLNALETDYTLPEEGFTLILKGKTAP